MPRRIVETRPYAPDAAAGLVGVAPDETRRQLVDRPLTPDEVTSGVRNATKEVKSARRRSTGGTAITIAGVATGVALHALALPVALAVDAAITLPAAYIAVKGAYDRGVLRRRGLTIDSISRATPDQIAKAYHTKENVDRADRSFSAATQAVSAYSRKEDGREVGSLVDARAAVVTSDQSANELDYYARTGEELHLARKTHLQWEVSQRPARAATLEEQKAGLAVAQTRQRDASGIYAETRQADKQLRRRVKGNKHSRNRLA